MKKNANKNYRDRRQRPAQTVATKREVYIEVRKKSQSGREYVHYVPTLVNIKK